MYIDSVAIFSNTMSNPVAHSFNKIRSDLDGRIHFGDKVKKLRRLTAIIL